jgi:glycosyltransferase involved in cell wall biosynthesis
MLFTVGYYYFEKFQRQFSIPREKMRLLPNYVEPKIYSQDKNGDVRFNIGLVGMLPALKGFLKGLKLLLKLRERDKRFRLYVMGQQPEEVPWIRNDSYESEYFEECGRFIADNDLDDAVIYRGFVERDELYSNIGYILSLSDVESFHLALAEGSCAGCMGLSLNWPGAEFIYPPETLCESIDEIAEKIVIASLNEKIYINNVTALRNYVSENYGIDCFLEVLNTYLKRLYTS